jgi:hypothetical protein
VLAIFSVCAIGFWLNYAHNRFVEVDPQFVATVGIGKVKESIPELEPKIKQQLVDAAPKLMETGEKYLTEMPDKFADQMIERTKAEMDKALPQLEDELVKSLKDALNQIKADRPSGMADGDFAKLVADQLAAKYATESMELIDELKTKYTGPSSDVMAHLERLADNKGLTKRESLERQALVTFLTIASRAKTAAAGM